MIDKSHLSNTSVIKALFKDWVYGNSPWVKRSKFFIAPGGMSTFSVMAYDRIEGPVQRVVNLDNFLSYAVSINTHYDKVPALLWVEEYLAKMTGNMQSIISKYMIQDVLLPTLPYTQTRFRAKLFDDVDVLEHGKAISKVVHNCMKQTVSDQWEPHNFIISSPYARSAYFLHNESNSWLKASLISSADKVWDLDSSKVMKDYICLGISGISWSCIMTDPLVSIEGNMGYVTVKMYSKFGAVINSVDKVLLSPLIKS